MYQQILNQSRSCRVWCALILALGLVATFGSPAFAQQDLQVSTYGEVRVTDNVSDANIDDLVEEDEDGAESRDHNDCNTKPYCNWQDGDYIELDPTVTNKLTFSTDAFCGQSMRIRLFFYIFRFYSENHADEDSARSFDLTIPADTFEDGHFALYTLEVRDNSNREKSYCKILVKFKNCQKRPACYYKGIEIDEDDDHSRSREHYVDYGDVVPGDVIDFEVCAKSRCGERARVEMFSRPPFLDPLSHRKGSPGEKSCISVDSDVVESGFAEGTYWAKFRCVDLRNDRETILNVGFTYSDPVCEDLPTCEADSAAITVESDSTGMFQICGSSPCDDCDVTIAPKGDLPAFVTAGSSEDGCSTYMVAPGVADAGPYTVEFTATDCNGATSECSIDIMVPAPLLACSENEGVLPNDKFADASVIDAGECVDEFGVNLYGVLDMPVVTNGDVDFYQVVGLTPGQVYTATIVAGLNTDNQFTDTMLGWLVADGVAVVKDDNSGPLAGYSKIEFTADEVGAATLAITGHGDENFDGTMAGGMPYSEYGFGGYMLSIRAIVEEEAMPLERQADLNNDGTVDSSDLGLLLGLFGNTSN